MNFGVIKTDLFPRLDIPARGHDFLEYSVGPVLAAWVMKFRNILTTTTPRVVREEEERIGAIRIAHCPYLVLSQNDVQPFVPDCSGHNNSNIRVHPNQS